LYAICWPLKLSNDDDDDDDVIGVDGFDKSSNENGLLSPVVLLLYIDASDDVSSSFVLSIQHLQIQQ